MTDTMMSTDVQDLPIEGTALEVYSGRSEVRELAVRLMRLHPAAQEVGDAGMLAVAQTALLIGANPLPGTNEIHVWKSKGKTQLQLGVNYHRRKGMEAGGWLWQIKPRSMTDVECTEYDVASNQKGAICHGVRRDDMISLVQAGLKPNDVWEMAGRFGVGTVNKNDKPKAGRPLIWTAQKRCEVDMLRKLFPNLENRKTGGEDWERQIEIIEGTDTGEPPEVVLARNHELLRGEFDEDDPFGMDTPAAGPVGMDPPPAPGPEWTEGTVDAGEVEPEPATGQAAMDLDRPAPDNPSSLLEAANLHTNGYYQAAPHLLNSIRSHLGDNWQWPTDDRPAYAEALQVAIDHAEANRK